LGGKGKKKKNGPNISRYWKLHPGGRTASGIKSWETRRANKNLRRVS
jgi:hypothetical protein